MSANKQQHNPGETPGEDNKLGLTSQNSLIGSSVAPTETYLRKMKYFQIMKQRDMQEKILKKKAAVYQ
jgi:hypothetical protein